MSVLVLNGVVVLASPRDLNPVVGSGLATSIELTS
jgi:hypothetical protein